MNTNVGGLDRTARLAIGAILVIVAVAGYAGLLPIAVGPVPQALGSLIVLVVGLILLVTGAARTCPINSLLGVNTTRR